MANFWQLQWAVLKQLFRNKEAIFWSLLFPLIFIFVFKLFGSGGGVNANVIVIDDAKNSVSEGIVTALKEVEGLGINTSFVTVEEATPSLQDNSKLEFVYEEKDSDETRTEQSRTNVILYIPAGYGDFTSLNATNPEFKIQLFYNQANEGAASPSGILQSIISQITRDITLQANQITDPFTIERTGVAVNDVRYYDILVPGIIGMGIMQSGIIGMATNIASLKEKRILKRLSATPLPIWQFILAQVVSYIVLSMLQVTVMLAVSTQVLGAKIYGSVPTMYFLAFIGVFVFLNIGFITAALSKTANAAGSLSNIFTMPMMFLSGVFFERDGLPETVKIISDFLPLTPLVDALRDVSLQGSSLAAQNERILIILAWTLVTFAIASWVFKFREE